jgi:tetratricopeptide (TPR) repeat protein
MKPKIFYIFFLFIIVGIPLTVCGNTKEYCEQLMKLSEDERVKMDYSKALEYLTEVKMLAEQNNWLDIKRQCVGRIAFVYADMMDYDKAMEYHIESYNISIQLSSKEGELTALNNIGLMCFESGKMQESLEYGEKAYNIAVELNDSLRITQLATNLASLANLMNNIPLSEKYIQIALSMLGNEKEFWESIYIELVMIDNFFKKGEYDKAEQLALTVFNNLQDAEYESEKFQKRAYKNIKPDLFIRLSTIYEKKNDLDKAISFAQEALHYNPTLKEEIRIYEQLSTLFRAKHLFDVAFSYQDSVIVKKDALSKSINNNNMEISRIKFNLLNSEKELAENKAKQKSERILFLVITVSISFFAVILLWVFRIQSIRNKQNNMIIELRLKEEENKKLLLEQQLKEQEALNLLEEERIQNEVNEKLLLKQQIKEQEMRQILEQERLNQKIDTKNKQLIARALSHLDRDKLLKEVVSELSDVSQRVEEPSINSVIRKLKMQLKDSAEWDNFLVQSEQINPALFSSLKEDYPQLSANDIHFLSYIYLNLNTKKIAYLLNISDDACRKKKQRVASKMGLKVGELYSFLVNKIKYSSL